MAAEQFDTSLAAGKPSSTSARFAAEASIRAAIQEQAPSPKNKKRKRNKQRRDQKLHANNVTAEYAAGHAIGHDEVLLDLGTPNEGEINMRHGETRVPAQPRLETSIAQMLAPVQEIVPSREQIIDSVTEAPPVPPGFQEFSQMLMGDQLPEQFKPPELEATPMHEYPAQEISRTRVTPISVEAHSPLSRANKTTGVPGEKPVSEMGRGELLRIAKNITIDGVKLKDVFNAKRIDKEGLRAVVETYLRGGDVKRQLAEEVVAKEQSFEKDPLLRHHRPASSVKLSGAAVKAASVATEGVRGFIRGHGPRLAGTSQKTAKKASRILLNGVMHAHQEIIDKSKTSDWLFITAIVIVWSLIIFLLFA